MAPPPHDRGKISEYRMLEIRAENRNSDKPMNINNRIIGEMCEKVGIDIPTVLLGYQIHFAYKVSTVNLIVKEGVQIDRYLRYEPFIFNEEIEVKSITQAGVKEVTMVVMGLDYAINDNVMFEYIKSFGGKIVSNKVIYSKDKQGPFKGLMNGERKYLVDMSLTHCNMGTYHYISESKVKIILKGNI